MSWQWGSAVRIGLKLGAERGRKMIVRGHKEYSIGPGDRPSGWYYYVIDPAAKR